MERPAPPIAANRRIAAVASPAIGSADLCHPTLVRKPFSAEGWSFELKHDGFRALARKRGTKIGLRSRWDRPLTQSFPEIVEALAGAEADFVVDAELVVPDEQGRADFERLRRRALLRRSRAIERAAVTSAAVLVAFDVLEADGVDVRPLPLHAGAASCGA